MGPIRVHCGVRYALAHVGSYCYYTMRPSPTAVRYGRVPKRPREPVAAETQPEPNRPTPSVATVTPADPMETILMRQQMSKELVKIITVAHRQTNTYTDEAKETIIPRAIVLRIDTEGEGG